MKTMMERVINELTDHKVEADLIFSSSKSLKMSAQKGTLSEYKVSSSQILGVRVIKAGKTGIAYSEAFDEESLKFMVKEALANAELSQENPHERIADLSGELHDNPVYQEEEKAIEFKIQKALELESEVKKRDMRVTAVPYNSYSENEYLSAYLSSRGRYTTWSDKVYGITSSALLEENGKKANYYDYHTAHVFQDLDFEKVIETSLYHARNILLEKPLITGKYNVSFTEDCLKGLVECFSNFYSAKSAMDKMNPWAQRTGELVTSSDITITDEPQYEDSFRKSFFDSEGVEQKSLTLVEKGILQNFYHNTVTANFFGTKTTGHASRGPGSSIGVNGTQLVIRGSNVKPLPGKYLEVIQMDGLHSGANRVTGTFSVAVKGYIWENGARTGTFGNCTLSGNIMDLMKNVQVTGETLKSSRDGSFFSVPLIFHELSIAGS